MWHSVEICYLIKAFSEIGLGCTALADVPLKKTEKSWIAQNNTNNIIVTITHVFSTVTSEDPAECSLHSIAE